MHTFPSATDARARASSCSSGCTTTGSRAASRARELAAVKRYLVKGHAFENDTAAKRLDQHLDIELFDWPKTHHTHFLPRVRATTREDVARALRRRMSRSDQVITVVATAEQIVPELREAAGRQEHRRRTVRRDLSGWPGRRKRQTRSSGNTAASGLAGLRRSR